MIYVFYVCGLISFAISNHTGFLILIQNSNIGFNQAMMISSIVTGLIYGYIFRYVLKSIYMIASISAVREIVQINKLAIVVDKNIPKKEKSEFSESHREKLRLSSLKRTRDANGRFK